MINFFYPSRSQFSLLFKFDFGSDNRNDWTSDLPIIIVVCCLAGRSKPTVVNLCRGICCLLFDIRPVNVNAIKGEFRLMNRAEPSTTANSHSSDN